MIATALQWCRLNLFAKPFDALLSIIVIPACAWMMYETVRWALVTARWEIIPESLRVLMIGVYPPDQIWRTWASLMILGALFGAALGCVFPIRRSHVAFFTVLLIAFGYTAIGSVPHDLALIALAIGVSAAGWFATSRYPRLRRAFIPGCLVAVIAIFVILAPPGVGLWGGLLLSVLITLVTAIVTLPLGILLAFGRRSRLSSVRIICTAYIEVMRSVPLILVVYWIWILVPVLAPDLGLADVARGMIGFTVFYTAYVAEYVRSGLQAVPRGQAEAARSLGMSTFDLNRDIVLPPPLRGLGPPLFGSALDIVNASPSVFIIGLTDFLRAGQMILANPQYSDRTYEIYSFLFVTYFLVGSLLTFSARRLEVHLARGSR